MMLLGIMDLAKFSLQVLQLGDRDTMRAPKKTNASP